MDAERFQLLTQTAAPTAKQSSTNFGQLSVRDHRRRAGKARVGGSRSTSRWGGGLALRVATFPRSGLVRQTIKSDPGIGGVALLGQRQHFTKFLGDRLTRAAMAHPLWRTTQPLYDFSPKSEQHARNLSTGPIPNDPVPFLSLNCATFLATSIEGSFLPALDGRAFGLILHCYVLAIVFAGGNPNRF
jgi:hypothetical protein